MKALITSLLLVCLLSCHSNKQKPLKAIASLETKEVKYQGLENNDMYNRFTTEWYELQFELNTLEDASSDLILNMVLKKDAYYVSPNAKRDFKGKFSVIIEENDNIETRGALIETPRSVEEYDPHPFVRGTVNWVRENTSYKQNLKREKDEDFTVSGYIIFTIEPSCTLEKIPFFIKNENGQMRVEIARC